MDKFLKLPRSRKLIATGSIVTILSLLFSWGGVEGYEYTALDFNAYLIIISLIYPMYCIYKDGDINQKKSMISLALGMGFIIYTRIIGFKNKFGDINRGQQMSVGMKLAILGILIAMLGTYLIYEDKE